MRLTPRKHREAGYATPDRELTALAQRANRHYAMRSLRVDTVHGQHCNCHRCEPRAVRHG